MPAGTLRRVNLPSGPVVAATVVPIDERLEHRLSGVPPLRGDAARNRALRAHMRGAASSGERGGSRRDESPAS